MTIDVLLVYIALGLTILYGLNLVQLKISTMLHNRSTSMVHGARRDVERFNAAPRAPLEVVQGGVIRLSSIAPWERQHTAVAGRTGDGKTFTLYTLLVAAIRFGAQVVVSSPQYTDFHPEHQRIDVTELRARGHFVAYWELNDTMRLLKALGSLIDQRLVHYRAGEPVGHPICVFIGEWGRVYDVYGSDAVQLLLKVLDSGRITNIWISYIEYHSALVSRTGGDSALRVAYKTRLAGNVDMTTWKAFVGPDIKPRAIPRNQWMTESGLVEIVGPSAMEIAMLARKEPKMFEPILPENEAGSEIGSCSDDEKLSQEPQNQEPGTDSEPVELSMTQALAIKRALDKKVTANDLVIIMRKNRKDGLAIIRQARRMTQEPKSSEDDELNEDSQPE